MMASPAEEPFDDPDHLFEPKWDGFRCVAFVDDGRVDLYSRSGRVITDGYPEVQQAMGHLKGDAVVDGELIVCDERGVPRFELIQQRNYAMTPPRRNIDLFPVRFVAFDLCWRDGVDLRAWPLVERRAALEVVGELETTPAIVGEGVGLYEEVVALGYEGIVGKRLDSPYRPATRTRAWRKVKAVNRERAVVVGFTAGTGARSPMFGSLVMAQWAGDSLIMVGEVGTGFDDVTLRVVRGALDQIEVDRSPLAPPFPRIPRVTWVEPGIVIDVEHRGMTREGRMRAPSFKGVCAGVDPRSVVRDTLAR